MNYLTQLYPPNSQPTPFPNTYLNHNLRHPHTPTPFIYANFITSLDGRIAIPHPSRPGLTIPATITNDRDWRLYQELTAQADLVISTGRYLRDWADGRAQEILQTDDPRFADLRQWRQDHNLPPYPDIAIISASLDFPLPDILTQNGRQIHIFTVEVAPQDRYQQLSQQTNNIHTLGHTEIDGQQLLNTFKTLGYQTIYSAAGPQILHLLLTHNLLNRLYLTFAPHLLASNPFATILTGPQLDPPPSLQLNTLYHDPHAFDGLGQLLASYDLH
ncbi:MAG TPA: dihydrofolate reductase family protein [Anaerolineae bacterium]|nr:dihydrofolate reductase family protein [Anaerolineae bacterium]